LPATISNCSNNYGPYHFPEKLIPLTILNALQGEPIPVYGDGKNVRDWLYVEDHCDAIWLILKKGKPGDIFNIGGECEKRNIDVVEAVCTILDELHPLKKNLNIKKSNNRIHSYKDLITFVADRPGHDRRYAINCDKIKSELGWEQKHTFEQGLKNTVAWFLNHAEWVNTIRSGDYQKWLGKNYSERTQ
jgi:dTDP-glucose 4,6-dehydratase